MGSSLTVIFSETHCLFLKKEMKIQGASVIHNSTTDTVFRKILPVHHNNTDWLYMLGQNGILLKIHIDDALTGPPMIHTIECNFI